MNPDDPLCTCGDPSSMHIDGCEQCFNGDCGCKEFEEDLPEESKQLRGSIEQMHKNYPKIYHGPGSGCPVEFCPQCKEVDESIT